jgi:catechol 2,3-dioxygenase-like lactoylglutathione lyase family enzyme
MSFLLRWLEEALPGARRPGNARAPRLAAMALHLFAGLRVRDFGAARQWYDRVLGEPTFLPHDTEAVWTVADERSVYVVEEPERAGGCVVLLFVDDLDARVAAIAARGIDPAERETYDNGVRKVTFRDPDGNELAFGGAPAAEADPGSA